MKLTHMKASLVALALFASPMALTQAQAASDGTMVLAQAEQGNKRIDNIRKFLQGGRNVSKLKDNQLEQRLKRARAFQKTPNLPEDLMAGLKQAEQELAAELASRQQGGGASTSETAAAGDQPADDAAATKKAKRAERKQAQNQSADGGEAAAGDGASAGEVDSFLASVKPLDGLSNKELRQQMRKAQQLSKTQGISGEQRKKLRQLVRDSRAAMGKKTGGNGQQAGTDDTADTGNDDNQADTATTQKQAQTDTGTAGGGAGADDAKAQELIAGNANAEKLSDADLRRRLSNIRDLLAANKLSPANRKALRERLATERTILRSRVGQKNNTDQTNQTDTGQSANVTGDNNTVNNTNVTVNNNTTINREVVRQVVNDRRPARDLSDAELRRRLRVLEFAVRDKSYGEGERVQWRGVLERDRVILRERLLTQRDRRRNDLRVSVGSGSLKFKLGMNFQPDRPPPPRYVFAAEADDSDLEEVLLAPPRREIKRKYTLDEVENSPDLRDAVSRIEIDTVRFGFGESFVREEELDSLDRIAEIMEKILAAHPGEVFMIEGHTDAVGSEKANLDLSRERAAAVKQALVTYYVIPPENLKTVGFGERFLKIPTEEAEAENRRVSVARITPLVGALDN